MTIESFAHASVEADDQHAAVHSSTTGGRRRVSRRVSRRSSKKNSKRFMHIGAHTTRKRARATKHARAGLHLMCTRVFLNGSSKKNSVNIYFLMSLSLKFNKD